MFERDGVVMSRKVLVSRVDKDAGGGIVAGGVTGSR